MVFHINLIHFKFYELLLRTLNMSSRAVKINITDFKFLYRLVNEYVDVLSIIIDCLKYYYIVYIFTPRSCNPIILVLIVFLYR